MQKALFMWKNQHCSCTMVVICTG